MTPHNTLLFLWDYVLLRPSKNQNGKRRAPAGAAQDGNQQTQEADEGSDSGDKDPGRLEEDDLRLLDAAVFETEPRFPSTSAATAGRSLSKDQRIRERSH